MKDQWLKKHSMKDMWIKNVVEGSVVEGSINEKLQVDSLIAKWSSLQEPVARLIPREFSQ